MIAIGIDPGKQGALCLRAKPGAMLFPMPLVKSATGRDEYDLRELERFLGAHRLRVEGSLSHGWHDSHAFIERLQAMPASMGGGVANYSRGYIMGALEATCVALSLPYTLVSPKRWQKDMLADIPGEDTKQRSIQAALRLFPGVSLKRTERSQKHDSGFADALLIAAWGWRQLNGSK